jgi:fumarylacetoacetase
MPRRARGLGPVSAQSPRSWVEGADSSGWPLNALPYGVGATEALAAQPLVRIGDFALPLAALAEQGLLPAPPGCFETASLNAFMTLGPNAWSAVRGRLTELLAVGSAHRSQVAPLLCPVTDLEMALPIEVADYVDFYSSREHASNLGRLFRPGSEPLLPNWHHLPVGYHGRSGTFVVSGRPIRRPHGQRKSADSDAPTFGPSQRLDFELEVGFVIGAPSPLGEPVAAAEAGEHIFGVVLLNDWSARDLQAWEYQPLGPFLGKSFATSISPWVVPLAALESARVDGPHQDPPVLDYLRVDMPWGFDIDLEVAIRTPAMAVAGSGYEVICRTNLQRLYWNPAQHVAHATVNGASLRAGDVHASGTVSGTEPDSFGSMIELAWGGERPLVLGGEQRSFLADGDSVLMRAVVDPNGSSPFSLGEVEGTIIAAGTW